MGDMFGDDDSNNSVQTVEQEQQEVYSDMQMEEYLFSDTGFNSKICTLLYGKDGTCKSGIVLDYIKQCNLKPDEKIIVIDLDGGCEPIALTHHTEAYIKTKQLIIKNPITETFDKDMNVVVDYRQTMNNIKRIFKYLKTNVQKQKVRAVVLDGLSTLLKYCEYQTRSDKHIAADGGMQLRYWINRQRFFMTIMEIAKSLPCDRFFIAHEDFNADEDDKEKSSVVRATNRMMFQKIACTTKKTKDGKQFIATIDKSKTNTDSEGKSFIILDVPNDKSFTWDTAKLYEMLQ